MGREDLGFRAVSKSAKQAYEAYMEALGLARHAEGWAGLSPDLKDAWEEAAAAALVGLVSGPVTRTTMPEPAESEWMAEQKRQLNAIGRWVSRWPNYRQHAARSARRSASRTSWAATWRAF